MEATTKRPENWDRVCDVLVIGFGAAGASAALEASSSQAEVIIADRFCGGGASIRSGNVFYAGGGTSIQEKTGIKDHVDAMMGYLAEETDGAVSLDMLKHFCQTSASNVQWLQNHGVRFGTKLYQEKTSYPPRGTDLYYSGNEMVARFARKAKPAPRGHIAKSFLRGTAGGGFYKPLKKAVRKSGIKTLYHARTTSLVVDEEGRVIGAVFEMISSYFCRFIHRCAASGFEALRLYLPWLARPLRSLTYWLEQHCTHTKRVRVKKAVILASGGFIANRAMVKRYASTYRRCMTLGTMGCSGSAVQLGLELGASTKYMDKISAWRFINPPLAWISGVLVNKHGERISDESLYGAALGQCIGDHHEGIAFLILDGTLYRRAWRQILFGSARLFQIVPAGLVMSFAYEQARDLDSLAEQCGFDKAKFKETIENYNAVALDQKQEDGFGKDRRFLHRLSKSYYALDVSFAQKFFRCPAMSLGGLEVDEVSGAVCRPDGKVILGLYAAGRAACGIVSRSYVSGLALADCIFSGRRAGYYASRQTIEEKHYG